MKNERIVSTVEEVSYRNDRLFDVLMKPVVPAPLEFNNMIEVWNKRRTSWRGYSECL